MTLLSLPITPAQTVESLKRLRDVAARMLKRMEERGVVPGRWEVRPGELRLLPAEGTRGGTLVVYMKELEKEERT
jgi:hypothetical protein